MRPELGQNVDIELTLEWNDHLGQPLGPYPLPGVEFRMVGREVDIRVASGKAHDEPSLPLAAIAPAPHPTCELRRQVVFQPGAALPEDLGLVGANLLLEFAQRRLQRGLARVDPTLRHLPGR